GRLRLIVLDVGQGDAIALEAPDGRVLLVDAGGGGPMRLDAGERVVAPFLWNRGHLRLAGAIVTHPDADHAGGMETVRRLFGPGATPTAPRGVGTTRLSCCASSTGSRRSCSRPTSRPRVSKRSSPRVRRSPRPSSRSRTTARERRAPPHSSAPSARRSL